MEIRIEYISNEKAKDIVNASPYKPNDLQKVRIYAEEMNDGEWVNANEHHLFHKKHYTVPIIFTDEGFLWEGKHRIHALAQSNASGFKFVSIRGWNREKATEEYQTGEKKYARWGYIVYVMYKHATNGYELTQIEDL